MMLLTAVERSLRPCKVLVVDDHRDFADTIAMLLARRGFEVRVVYGGKDALDVVAEFEPHVIVCEPLMPGHTGYQLAEQLRADPVTWKIALIAVSGYSDHNAERKALAAGFDRFLLKPLSSDRLCRAIDSLNQASDSAELA